MHAMHRLFNSPELIGLIVTEFAKGATTSCLTSLALTSPIFTHDASRCLWSDTPVGAAALIRLLPEHVHEKLVIDFRALQESDWTRLRSRTRDVRHLRFGSIGTRRNAFRKPAGRVGDPRLSEAGLLLLLFAGRDTSTSMVEVFPRLRQLEYAQSRLENLKNRKLYLPDHLPAALFPCLTSLPFLQDLNICFHFDGHAREEASLPTFILPPSLCSLQLTGGPEQVRNFLRTVRPTAGLCKLSLSLTDSQWREDETADHTSLLSALRDMAGPNLSEVTFNISDDDGGWYHEDEEEQAEEEYEWGRILSLVGCLSGENLRSFRLLPPFAVSFVRHQTWASLAARWPNLTTLHLGRHEFYADTADVTVELPVAVSLALVIPTLTSIQVPFKAPRYISPYWGAPAPAITHFGCPCGCLNRSDIGAVVDYLTTVFPSMEYLAPGCPDCRGEDGWDAVRSHFAAGC
ncbi:hypothetical protein DXG01_009394 [Tephrocybe rancida]|nr:hypothetical protein DXG01_009394 [Tephrocybe rancida]